MGTRALVTDPVFRLSPTWRMGGGVQEGCRSPEGLRHGAACDLSVTLGRERREGQGWVLRSPWERAGSLCPGWDLWVY